MESYRNASIFTFYGWRVLLISSLMGSMVVGLTISGFPVFFIKIREDLGLTNAAVSLVLALAWAQSGVVAPLIGWVADHSGARKLVFWGGITCGIGLVLVSQSDQFWQLIIFYSVIIAVGRTACINPTLMAVINQWFVRKRSIAMSILGTSATAGGAICLPLLAIGSQYIGWRDTILVSGIFLGLLTFPVTAILRNKPNDLGLMPDGDPVIESSCSDTDKGYNGLKLNEAIGTLTFWLILLGVVFRVSVADAIMIHGIPLLVWKGASEQSASFYMSLVFILMIPLRLGFGVMGGYASIRLLQFSGMAIGAMGILGFLLFETSSAIYSFIIGLAMVEGISVLNWIAVAEYFGRRSFASLVGIMTVFYSAGALGLPVFVGWIYDRTMDYSSVLMIMAPLLLISGILFGTAKSVGKNS